MHSYPGYCISAPFLKDKKVDDCPERKKKFKLFKQNKNFYFFYILNILFKKNNLLKKNFKAIVWFNLNP